MATENYIKTLARFISGNISVSKLEKAVDNRLSELRRNPGMNPEKSVLSTIDLYLHEMNEGFRDKAELYALVQAIMDEMTQSKTGSKGVTVHKRCVVNGARCVISHEFSEERKPVANNTTEIKDISLVPVN
jgi:hypothetical protein